MIIALIVLGILLSLIVFVIFFLRQPKFGKTPYGAELARMKASPNYRHGQFQNHSHTPALTEGVSYYSVFKEFFFRDKKKVKPHAVIPTKKTDLLNLDLFKDVFVWFGHSSYFMQL